jgi:uncharacterized protein (DUF302 family)
MQNLNQTCATHGFHSSKPTAEPSSNTSKRTWHRAKGSNNAKAHKVSDMPVILEREVSLSRMDRQSDRSYRIPRGLDNIMDAAVDLIEHLSGLSFQSTQDLLVNAIEAAGMTIFARIDHYLEARSAGLSMPPTVVLIYGNPKAGTPIMLSAPQAALDLPLRVLVREELDGRVVVSFHPIVETLRVAGVPNALAIQLRPAQQLLLDAIQSSETC